MTRAYFVGALAIALLILACSDNDPPTGPTTGSLTVTLITYGEDAPSGYTIVLDGSTSRSVDANGSTTFTNVSEGLHEVGISGIPENCTTGGDDTVGKMVTAGGEAHLAMTVMCDPLVGSIEVSVTSSGVDIPDSHRVVVDGGVNQQVGATGSVTFGGLPVGSHEVELTEVPANCLVTGDNPVSVLVDAGNTALVTMNLECSQGSQLVFTRVTLGEYSISMIDVDGTDFVQLADSGIATDVSSDGTKVLYFTPVSSAGNAVWQMNADGSAPVQLTTTTGIYEAARWSPDGLKIAYAYRTIGGVDPDHEIWVMNADGSDPVQLTDNQWFTDYSPAWSPDGSKIAFVTTRDGNYEIYTMDADGANQTRVTNDVADDLVPDWSPDGLKIAFASNRGPDILEIWVMDADGSNAVQLTTGLSVESGVEPYPAWSPDGSRIAFSAELVGNLHHNIGVMNADGSNIEQLTAGFTDVLPRWRPRGP